MPLSHIRKSGTLPVFKIKAEIEKYQIKVLSSNYALYGDMSDRVMQVISQFSPELEVYSIDEAFLDLTGFSDLNLTEYSKELRARVLQWVGIPVSVGIGASKTLAKLANKVAKKSELGVFDLCACKDPDLVLAKTEVGDVWGIGRKWGVWLSERGITNALLFRDADQGVIKKKLGIVGVRLQLELQGISCMPFVECPPPKQNTCVSRSFGQPVTSKAELKEAVAFYISRAGEKLRRQKQVTSSISVFARSSPFKGDLYSVSRSVEMPTATNDTAEMLQYALPLVDLIYVPGVEFKKAGVMMLDLRSENAIQASLFDQRDRGKSKQLMQAIDLINLRYGQGSVSFAAAGVGQGWRMQCGNRTARSTSEWSELRLVGVG